uniref:hypothetical protein n=1 Tax=Carnobacterium TaxID=2747 RepID=UPI0034508F92
MKKIKKPYQALIFGMTMAILKFLFQGGDLNQIFLTFLGSFLGSLIPLYILFDKEGNYIKYY